MVVKNFRNCKGVTAVEFALIAIILFLVLFGIIEFGLVLYNKQVITEAVREGARAGIVWRADSNGDPNLLSNTEIRAVINNYLINHLVNFGAEAAYQPPNIRRIPFGDAEYPYPEDLGRVLEVTVQYDYNLVVLHGFIPDIVWQHLIPIQKTRTVMKMELG